MSQSSKAKYISYTNFNGLYKANQKEDVSDKLPSGVYDLIYDRNNEELYFQAIESNHDALIDLPETSYDRVVSELEKFLLPETKDKFKEYGYLYKRSSLLYGVPGTGKTCIVNRIANKVKEQGGIILFNPDPQLLKMALQRLKSTQPETTVVVIFEELDELMARYEDKLLYILDGQSQHENVIYLATTNYIEKIPERVRRPGRFSSVIEVGFPGAQARRHFLNQKLVNPQDGEIDSWVAATEGLSIDELSACVKDVKCLGYDLGDTVKRMLGNERLVAATEDSEEADEDQDEVYTLVGDPQMMRDMARMERDVKDQKIIAQAKKEKK